jgi:Sulfotransferase family
MLSIKQNFLFIHAPKTGGNSLQYILSHYSEDDIVTTKKRHGRFASEKIIQDGKERFEVHNKKYKITKKHFSLSEYKSVLEDSIYQKLFKFSVIRNPWDRMISFYFSPHRGIKWDRQTFIDLLERAEPLRFYICDNEPLEKKSGFIRTTKNHDLANNIDALLRFEHLNDDFKSVCQNLEITLGELPQLNKSTRMHYSYYYDDHLKNLVHEKFIEEVNYGKYQFQQD